MKIRWNANVAAAMLAGSYPLGWLVDYSYIIATGSDVAILWGIVAAFFWPIHGAVMLWQWILA